MRIKENTKGEKKYWIIYGFFAIGLILITAFINVQIYKSVESEFENHINSDLTFLSNHIKTELENGDYEGVSDLIKDWGRLHMDETLKLRLISSNGYVIAEFNSGRQPAKSIIESAIIKYGKERRAVLEFTADLTIVDKGASIYYLYFGSILLLTIIFLAYIIKINLKRRRTAIEMLRSNKELRKFSTAFNQSPSCIVITDTDGNIEYVNPQFTNLTGYAKEEVLGENSRVLNSGKISSVVFTGLWDTIKSGKIWRGELLNRKKNGELYWEDAVISPVHDEKGEIINFIGIKFDITDWKKTQKDLKEHKERLEETVKERTKDLEEKNEELKEFNKLFIGREMKIKELSLKLKELEGKDRE